MRDAPAQALRRHRFRGSEPFSPLRSSGAPARRAGGRMQERGEPPCWAGINLIGGPRASSPSSLQMLAIASRRALTDIIRSVAALSRHFSRGGKFWVHRNQLVEYPLRLDQCVFSIGRLVRPFLCLALHCLPRSSLDHARRPQSFQHASERNGDSILV